METVVFLMDGLARGLNFIDDLSFTIAFFISAYVLYRLATQEIRQKGEEVEKAYVFFVARSHFTSRRFFIYRLSILLFCMPLIKLSLFLLLYVLNIYVVPR